MENNEPIRDQEIEIDLVALFHELVKHWKALVASMVLLAAVFGLYSKITFVPEYEASAEMYVLTKSTSITSLAAAHPVIFISISSFSYCSSSMAVSIRLYSSIDFPAPLPPFIPLALLPRRFNGR